MYLHDFVPPSDEKDYLLPMIREWNALGRTPHIRVATPKEFFTYIVSKYEKEIPTYQGDWSGLWTGVKTNSPEISALARLDQLSLRANGLLWATLHLRGASEFPSGNMLEDYRRVWNYDEHSGAGQAGWPDLMTVREVNDQNADYVDYVTAAQQDQQFLFEKGIDLDVEWLEKSAPAASPANAGPMFVVYRPQSWAATSVIGVPEFPDGQRPAAFKDLSSGNTFPAQWSTGCPRATPDRQSQSCGVMAAPLPASGVALFEPMLHAATEGASGMAGSGPSPAPSRPTLENRFYELKLRVSDGAIVDLIDKDSGKQIINVGARDGFNQPVRVAGREWIDGKAPVNFVAIQGPVYDSLQVQRPGSYAPLTEYRLYHAVKRLEIRNLLMRSRMPIVTESGKVNTYQFAFPLLPGGTIDSFRYVSGFGVTTFPQDYLPGARMDAVVSHGLIFSDGDFHVALASPQAYYWDVPGFNRQHWQLWQNEVLSTVLRKNDAGATRDYGYYLFPTMEPGLPDQCWIVYDMDSWSGPWSDGDAYRRIWDAVMNPVSEVEPWAPLGSLKDVAESFFATNQPDVVVMAATASLTQPGGIVIRLQNLSGRQCLTQVTLPADGLAASVVDLTETLVGAGHLPVTGKQVEVQVEPHATVSILVSRHTE